MGYNPSGTDCSSRGPPQIIPPTRSLLQPGLSTGCRAVLVAFPHSSLTVSAQHFLPFLKYILTEVPPTPLLGSALASTGAARASSKWLCPSKGKAWSFLRGHPSSTSCYQNLGTCPQHKILSQTHEKMGGCLGRAD